MNNHNQKLGQWGEIQAVEYLKKQHYSILDRNFRSSAGEIDLIALDQHAEIPCLVFIEVKTRTSDYYGYPEDSITTTKWRHLLAVINDYLEGNPQLNYDWRIDIIAIRKNHLLEQIDLMHYPNVVSPDERES